MELQGYSPEYVLQPHAVSRAIYRLSATARKLAAMGMALLPADLSSLTVEFSYSEFCRALGLERSGKHYELLQSAIVECASSEIIIDTPEKWKAFVWIQTAEIDKKTNIISLTFSSGLAEYLAALKRMYAKINLTDFGKLQSFYAIRLFEMAKSYESLAGKDGNSAGCWFYERSIEILRQILGVETGKYTRTNDFRRYVIELPLKELNESNLGLQIKAEYIRRGKYLTGVRFFCKQAAKKKRVAASAQGRNLRDEASFDEQEAERLKKLYPDEYTRLYEELIKNPENDFFRDMPHLWEMRVDKLASDKLKERHGIRR